MRSRGQSWSAKGRMPVSGRLRPVRIAVVVLSLVAALSLGLAIVEHGVSVCLYLATSICFVLFLNRPHTGLYVMIFLVPLQNLILHEGSIVVAGAQEYQGATTLVRGVGILAFVAWMVHKLVMKERMRHPLAGRVVLPMVVYGMLSGASALWAADLGRWRVSMFTLVQLIAWVVLMLDLINSPRRLEWAMFAFLLGCLISFGLACYWFYVVGLQRAMGGFGSPNASAALAMSALPFLVLLVTQRRGWQALFGLFGAALALLSIGLSVSRTALTLLPILVLLQLLAWRKVRRQFARSLLLLVISLLAFSLFPWAGVEERFGDAVEEQLLHEKGRAARASAALDLLRERPILGHGLANSEDFPGHYLVAHNLYLQIASELGLAGLLVATWMGLSAWGAIRQAQEQAALSENREAVGFLSALRISFTVYLLYSLAASTQDSRMLWLLLALIAISWRLARRLPLPHREEEPDLLYEPRSTLERA